ncbi:MAG: APC family permease [Chitinophagaceae bacterium]
MKKTADLGVFDLTMIVVSLVIGMGIFKAPQIVAGKADTPMIFFLAWVVGGVVALCGALTYAEIGSRYPVTGGYYKIFSYCYHPSVAFMINGIILVSNAASTSAVALIGSEYISPYLFPHRFPNPSLQQGIAIGAILIFYCVNFLGLRMSARTQNLLTLVKIGMILVLILAIFVPGNSSIGLFHSGEPTGWLDHIRSFGLCMIPVSFSYGGYQQTINFGGEIRDPRRIIPKAIFRGIILVILLYLTINYAYLKVIGFQSLKSADSIAALLAHRIFGTAGGEIFSILLFFSVLAYVNVLLLSNPRVIFAMSQDRILPSFLQKKHPRTGAMVPALTCFTAISVLSLIFAKGFDQLLNYTIFLDSIGMATSAATLFILRKRTSHLNKNSIYSMKLFPLQTLVFILAYIFVAVSIIGNDPRSALYGFILLVSLFPIYWILKNLENYPQKKF